MADKITLIEFHAHSDGSDFTVEPMLGSGIGKLLGRTNLGTDTDEEDGGLVDSLAPSTDTGTDTEDVEEIDYDEEFEDALDDEDDLEESDGGSGRGRLLGLLAIVMFVAFAQRLRGGDDEDDPFEEEFGQ